MVFNKQTTQERASLIIQEYREKLNSWTPKYNNAFKLYDANGKEWKNVDASQIQEVDNKTAWEGMPKEAIDYLKSLPEWDAAIFKEITGIDTNEINLSGSEVSVTVNGKTYKEVIK
jgi:phosphomannomutase